MSLLLLALALAVGGLLARLAVGLGRLLADMRVLNRLPHPPMGLLGYLEVFKDKDHMAQAFTRLADELGAGIFYVRALHVPIVVVSDPGLWQAALQPGVDLPKARSVYSTINQLTSPGGRQPNLLGHRTHDKYWRLLRKGVAHAFSPRNIRAEFPHVLELSQQLSAILSELGPSRYVDVDNLLQRESLDVIGRVGFGTAFGTLKSYLAALQGGAGGTNGSAGAANGAVGGAEGPSAVGGDVFAVMSAATDEITLRLSNPLRTLLKHVTPGGRQGERHVRELQARMRALLAEIRARGPPSEDDTSIAAHLLRIRDPATGKPLSDEQLAGEIGLFFFAGSETTGHTMAWTLFCLAQNPEVEAKVCAELAAHGLLGTPERPEPRPLAYEDLSRLRYLGMVLKECMRFIPVSGGTVRSSDAPLQLGGHTIPAGVEILFASHGLMNSAQHWDRPREFLPERWEDPQAEYWLGAGKEAAAVGVEKGAGGAAGGYELVEDEEALKVDGARPPKRYLPFAAGQRNCIGQNLAKMNATATLATLLGRFSFQLPPELQGPGALWSLYSNRLSMQPKDGLPMHCVPRAGLAAS